MKIENIQISNLIGKVNETKGEAPEGFITVLNSLLNGEENPTLELGEINEELIDLILEEEGEDEEIDHLAMMANIPLQTKILSNEIDLNLEDIELEGISLEEGPISDNIRTSLNGDLEVEEFSLFNENAINEDMITENIEDEVSFSEEETILNEKNKNFKEEFEVLNRETLSPEKIESSKIEETSVEVAKEDINMEKDLPLKEREMEFKDNQWMDTPIREVQTNTLESIENVELQENTFFAENIERVSDSIIKLMETKSQGDTKVMKVKLYPEELGNVDITLKMEDGKLIAKILVDNDQVRQLFINNINDLNENLYKQNIHIGNLEIDLNNNPNEGFNGQGNNSSRPNRGFRLRVTGLENKIHYENIEASGISILA